MLFSSSINRTFLKDSGKISHEVMGKLAENYKSSLDTMDFKEINV